MDVLFTSRVSPSSCPVALHFPGQNVVCGNPVSVTVNTPSLLFITRLFDVINKPPLKVFLYRVDPGVVYWRRDHKYAVTTRCADHSVAKNK